MQILFSFISPGRVVFSDLQIELDRILFVIITALKNTLKEDSLKRAGQQSCYRITKVVILRGTGMYQSSWQSISKILRLSIFHLISFSHINKKHIWEVCCLALENSDCGVFDGQLLFAAV